MQKKNKTNLFKKIFCAFLLSFGFLVSSFCLSSSAATLVNSVSSGYYRINANSHIAYEALLKEYTTQSGYDGTRSGLFYTPFELYDVDGNLIFNSYIRESEQYSFGFDDYVGYFLFYSQAQKTTYYSYFDSDKEGSKWYYIYFPNDPVASDWRAIGGVSAETIFNIMFNGTSLGFYDNLFVKTELGEDLPNEDEEYDIPSGTYKFNYGFDWPLEGEVEFSGSLIYDDVSYSRLRISNSSISLVPSLTTGNIAYLYDNGWLVSDPTFETTGLFNSDSIHNAVISFLSVVNGTSVSDNGLLLTSDSYTFKDILSYPSVKIIFDDIFKTGEDLKLSYNGFIYSSILDTLYYGEESDSNIVYQNGSWVDEIYKNFSYNELITDYKVASFLAQNLDIYNLDEKYYIKGYYYFNDSLLVENLLDLSFLSEFSYIHKGTIYNSFLPYYNVVTNDGVVVNRVISLSFYNTNTKTSDVLLSGSYTSNSQYIRTKDSLRQIYISPSLVNYDTYTWLNENGLFIYYNDSDNTDFGDLMLVFPDVIIHFFASVLSFDLFGIDVYTAICSILTVVLAIWLIRKLL